MVTHGERAAVYGEFPDIGARKLRTTYDGTIGHGAARGRKVAKGRNTRLAGTEDTQL
jgi:hypothetical protein